MHYIRNIVLAFIALASIPFSLAQVSTACQPLTATCPNDKGLDSSSYFIDFAEVKSQPQDWILADYSYLKYGPDGAEFTFAKRYDAPTMHSSFKFFFGSVEIVAKAAKGRGIISSMVLLSGDLDEIDWETTGTSTNRFQTNYFGKGILDYGVGQYVPAADPQSQFHKFTIDWSPTSLTWSIDGAVVRTVTAAQAGNTYPQTPMAVSLSLWDGGDPDMPEGTRNWAGGVTPIPPPENYTMYIKSVKIQNANPAHEYQYTDHSGSYKSIKIINSTSSSSSSSTHSSTKSSSSSARSTVSSSFTSSISKLASIQSSSQFVSTSMSASSKATASSSSRNSISSVSSIDSMASSSASTKVTNVPVTVTVKSGSTSIIKTSSMPTTIIDTFSTTPCSTKVTSIPTIMTIQSGSTSIVRTSSVMTTMTITSSTTPCSTKVTDVPSTITITSGSSSLTKVASVPTTITHQPGSSSPFVVSKVPTTMTAISGSSSAVVTTTMPTITTVPSNPSQSGTISSKPSTNVSILSIFMAGLSSLMHRFSANRKFSPPVMPASNTVKSSSSVMSAISRSNGSGSINTGSSVPQTSGNVKANSQMQSSNGLNSSSSVAQSSGSAKSGPFLTYPFSGLKFSSSGPSSPMQTSGSTGMSSPMPQSPGPIKFTAPLVYPFDIFQPTTALTTLSQYSALKSTVTTALLGPLGNPTSVIINPSGVVLAANKQPPNNDIARVIFREVPPETTIGAPAATKDSTSAASVIQPLGSPTSSHASVIGILGASVNSTTNNTTSKVPSPSGAISFNASTTSKPLANHSASGVPISSKNSSTPATAHRSLASSSDPKSSLPVAQSLIKDLQQVSPNMTSLINNLKPSGYVGPSSGKVLPQSSANTTSLKATSSSKPSASPTVSLSTQAVVTTEIVYTTVTSCPITNTITPSSGKPIQQVTTILSTVRITSTSTICTKCVAPGASSLLASGKMQLGSTTSPTSGLLQFPTPSASIQAGAGPSAPIMKPQAPPTSAGTPATSPAVSDSASLAAAAGQPPAPSLSASSIGSTAAAPGAVSAPAAPAAVPNNQKKAQQDAKAVGSHAGAPNQAAAIAPAAGAIFTTVSTTDTKGNPATYTTSSAAPPVAPGIIFTVSTTDTHRISTTYTTSLSGSGDSAVFATVSTIDSKGNPKTYATWSPAPGSPAPGQPGQPGVQAPGAATPGQPSQPGAPASSVQAPRQAGAPAPAASTVTTTITTTDSAGNPTTYTTSTPAILAPPFASTVSTTDASGNPTTYETTVTPTLTATMSGADTNANAGAMGTGTVSMTSQKVVATQTNSKTAYATAPTDASYGVAGASGTGAAMGTGTGAYNATGSPIMPFMGMAAGLRASWWLSVIVGVVGIVMVW